MIVIEYILYDTCGCWQQYGEVTAVLVSQKKNGSAIVEFSRHDAAVCEIL